MGKQIITTISLAIIAFFAMAEFQPSGKVFASGKPAQSNSRIIKAEQPIPNEYIVVLKDDISEQDLEKKADKIARRYGGKISSYYKYGIKGFSVTMSEAAAVKLSRHPLVKFIEENAVQTLSGGVQSQSPTPNWGLDRIDQFHLPLNNTYYYSADGTGVHVFIIDTGIRYTHQEFLGNTGAPRVDLGNSKNLYDLNNPTDIIDCNGHGTAVASIAGGRTFGVAKNVTLHAVRIAHCKGASSTKLEADGLEYVLNRTRGNPRLKPAVVNFSWNPLKATENGTIANFTWSLINQGITVVNSAGNDNTNAANYTPTYLSPVIVVGATDITDTRATYTFPPSPTQFTSNYGSIVDLFAPGINVQAASFESDTATSIRSGTSFAAPHVTGAAALYLQSNPNVTPAQVESYIVNRATPNKVKNVPIGTTTRILYTGSAVFTSP